MDLKKILELGDVLRDHLLHFCCLEVEETESRRREMTFSRLKNSPKLSMLMLLWAYVGPEEKFLLTFLQISFSCRWFSCGCASEKKCFHRFPRNVLVGMVGAVNF